EACVAVAVQLLGVGEGTLDGLLAALVDGLAPWRQAVGVGALAFIGPDVTGDGALCLGIGRAGCEKRAVSAGRRIALVVAVARAVGGGIDELLTCRTAIDVERPVVDELRLAHHAGLRRIGVAVAGDAENVTL